MNLVELLKKKIVSEVLESYHRDWSTLVYDETVANIIYSLFSKTDLLAYNIMSASQIDEDRPDMDFPVIYFVSCNKQIAEKINSEHSNKKYSTFIVISLTTPEDLDSIIKSKVVELNIQAYEERLFTCEYKDLKSLSNILDANFTVSYIEDSNICESIATNVIKDQKRRSEFVNLIVLQRCFDLITPFIHFYTFKSALEDLGYIDDTKDTFFPEIRYVHVAEASTVLEFHINKLNKNMEKLNSKNVDTNDLGKMVLDAPKNIELKDNISKYSDFLKKCFDNIDDFSDLIEAEQTFATGKDNQGNRVPFSLDRYFELFKSSKYTKEDKRRLLFLIKSRGVLFSRTEIEIIKNYGFDEEDAKFKFITDGALNYEQQEYQYDISRFEPILCSVIIKFLRNNRMFRTIGNPPETAQSLRKSSMISAPKTSGRKKIVVYILDGIFSEEARIVYELSEKLGIDIVLGSNKKLDPYEFMEEVLKNPRLHIIEDEEKKKRK